jgi:hypothetical protein
VPKPRKLAIKVARQRGWYVTRKPGLQSCSIRI